ncbi:MAG: transporter [Verrucomicrobia bacterium]|nr:transporter [Verrucomicrobiota bacterium]
MTRYDYAVLVFYFGYMLAISWVFRRFVTNVSDYFRGGGKALWWMVGGSAFMVQFSAWTFTGAASKAYADGWPIMIIYLGNAFGFALNALHFAPRFRQLRVVTGVEAIRHRFGRVSEQFFTWTQLPFGLLQAGIWLNSLAVFFSAVFGVDLSLTIIVTGAVVLVMALVGGSWAVLASDFIQVLILMPVCLAVTVLGLIKVGGFGGFLSHAPAHHLDLGQVFSKEFLGLWCVAMLLKQLHTTNNLADANRYLCVKDSRHARWAGFLGATLFLLGIVIWFLPPMFAAIRFPDLRAVFPTLKNPEEAAFIAIARDVMPVGMMGLLVSGIFAATMSSMDSGLNKNTGFFIKNFYQPVLKPHATDRHLLVVGKVVTVIFGALVILVALQMSQLKNLTLFQLTQRLSILIGIPIIVPLFLGLLVKHTPPWSAWSTVVVGFLSSLFITEKLTPEWAAGVFGIAHPLDAAAREYWRQSIELFGNVALCSTWFVATKLFWSRATAAEKTQIDEFFTRLRTPVDFAKEEGAHNANDARQSSVVGWLCLAYGAFVALLALIPNPALGRLAFLGCGGVVAAVGWALLAAARRTRAEAVSA